MSKLTIAKAERIMRQAFRISLEDGSIDAFGSLRDIETAEFMAAEGLRRMEAMNRIPAMERALKAASHALRSYQYGNSATDLAKATADHCDAVLEPEGTKP